MADNWEFETEDAIFFWGGIMSNWSKHGFDARLTPDGEVLHFSRSEQYMMAQKATVFDDPETLWFIMNTDNPAHQKAFGKKVKGFDDARWAEVARDLSVIGIYEKFRQNDRIRETMLSTKDKLLVEASPFDRRWGIGYDHIQCHGNEERWGQNWLGQCLMLTRDRLRDGGFVPFQKNDWSRYENWRK